MNHRITKRIYKRAESKLAAFRVKNNDTRSYYEIAQQEKILTPKEKSVFLKIQNKMIQMTRIALNEIEADELQSRYEAFLDRATQAMERIDAENAVCCDCHKHYPIIIEKITDANGSRFFCPNCLAFSCHDMSLVNIPNLQDDITGKPGAVVFEAYKERYQLDAECMRRLISHSLKPHEVLALRKKYGAEVFMLHDDFYDDEGHTLQ